jgi:polysaccharide export outer membrane protein
MKPFGFLLETSTRVALALSLCALAVVGSTAFGQATPGQMQQMLGQNGEQIRQRIRESGLTADQIRSRLRASGYPDNLLDPYLGSGALPTGVQPGGAELSAIQALGFGPLGATQQVDTGMIRWRGDTLVAKSNVFGVDVFRRSTTQFLPLLAGPVPPDYHLGPRDVLVLILTGDVELAYTLQVTREGFVFIPQVGQVFVSNLTLDQLRDVLYSRLGRVYSGIKRGTNATTRFNVSVANVRANQIFVVGEVAQPGAYQISSLGTVLTALYAAGGITERANMRGIEVQRLGKPVASLDLYDYLLRGDTRSDIRLETGDVVFVPVHETRVQVSGAVIRPGIYELKTGEQLGDLLAASGGFRADAALQRVTVHRILAAPERGPGRAPRAALDIALATAAPTASGTAGATAEPGTTDGVDGLRGQGTSRGGSALGAPGISVPALALMDGDSVVVDSLPPLSETYYVAIAGRVNKPGRFPWRPGMTLRDLVQLARGPTIGAYLKEAEISRLPEDRSRGQLATTMRVPLDSTYLLDRGADGRFVGPPGVPVPASGAAEVPLEPYDNVLIMEEPQFDLQRSVVVSGQVRYPGTYSLHSKEDRLADVITRAGGLTQQAYPEGVRFVRAQNGVGRVNIDLPQALKDQKSRHNVILQPEDSIYVPEYQPTVKVMGAVNAPGSLLWQRGKDLDYYISAAGGLGANADGGRTSVRFANGDARTSKKWLFWSSKPTPGPGSEVSVPTKPPSEKVNTVALMGAIASILTSLVAIVAVTKSLK